MSEIENKSNNNIFEIPSLGALVNNQRFTTRYIREDINATITYPGLFYFDKSEIGTQLLDIASNGALVLASKKIPLHRRIILHLAFPTGKRFDIACQCVHLHEQPSAGFQYGIKFDQYNNELGDYMLETQTKLLLK